MALESIALIPSGVKATKVYSQLPVNGNGDFTFDRGTSTDQTRVNKNGLIESVAQDVPRLDYLDGGCPSLLLEPASTNLITYSEEFDNAAWLKARVSISANAILSPDGSVNADELVEDTTASNSHYTSETVSVVAGTHTFSVFAKANTRSWVQLYLFNATDGARSDTRFDLINGVVGQGDGTIEDYGNGWYRCSITATSTITSEECFIRLALDATTTSYTGDGTSGIYIYGAQLEQQSYATSYVRSLGSQGVRNAETCNGAGTTAEINSQEGVLFFEAKTLEDDVESGRIALSDGTTNNYYSIDFRSTPDTLRIVYAEGGANIIVQNISNVMTTNNYNKIAFHYKTGDYRIYFNGLLIWTSSETNIFSSNVLNELEFSIGGGSPFYGRVKRLSVYDQALSTTELESLTGFSSFSEMKSYLSYS